MTPRPYLSLTQLAAVTPWTPDAIRRMIGRQVLVQGVHYFRPFGRRTQLVFKWDAIRELIEQPTTVPVSAMLTPAAPSGRRKGLDVDAATKAGQRLLDRGQRPDGSAPAPLALRRP